MKDGGEGGERGYVKKKERSGNGGCIHMQGRRGGREESGRGDRLKPRTISALLHQLIRAETSF